MMYIVRDEKRNFKGTLLRLKGVMVTNFAYLNDQNLSYKIACRKSWHMGYVDCSFIDKQWCARFVVQTCTQHFALLSLRFKAFISFKFVDHFNQISNNAKKSPSCGNVSVNFEFQNSEV